MPFAANYSVLTASQAANFRLAIEGWDPAFRGELTETNDLANPGRIRVAFTNSEFAATAGPPPDRFVVPGAETPPDGDIWLPSVIAGHSLDVSDGANTDFFGMVWRVGQALGLRFLPTATELPDYNNNRFSVMSLSFQSDYLTWHVRETASGPEVTPYVVLPTTPMMLDVFTLEVRYGAPAANLGDTTYTWAEDRPIMMTIVDSGGVDTLDLSTHKRPSVINLADASYSSIGHYPQAQQLADLSARYPSLAAELTSRFSQSGLYSWSSNVGISYKSIIENVRAGSGSDAVQGNAAGNTISGGAGDDFIDGVSGDDSLDGGVGADRVFGGAGGDTITDAGGSNYLRGDDGADRITGGVDFDDINGNAGNDTASGGDGEDWVVGGKDNDSLSGGAAYDLVYGNLGNDTCDGGAGNDIIRGGQDDDLCLGGEGDDYVSGDKGSDTMTGGAGADIFHSFGDAGVDRVTDFSLAQGDRVQVDPGTQYTVSQVGADTVISMTGGAQMILVDVQMSSLSTGWIFGA